MSDILSHEEALELEEEIALENKNNETTSPTKLTPDQAALIERNRQKALLLKQARIASHPYTKIDKVSNKSVLQIQGSKFIDSGGGFLLEEKEFVERSQPGKPIDDPGVLIGPDQPTCEECGIKFHDSFLFQSFEYPVCDGCRDNNDKHSLITRTDAKKEYLLKDCDFDKREPPLKFILRKNPHNIRWGSMKLYLHLQVEKRALEVWESEEKLEEAKETLEEKRCKMKIKNYNKKVKALRMSVRSTLFNRTTSASHEHTFGTETYNEEDDTYSHTCQTCGFEETFEKM